MYIVTMATMNETMSDMDLNQMMENVRNRDKGYNRIYRTFFNEKKKLYYKKGIDIYTSSPGSKIRNAETGEYFNYKVGSLDEDLFFSVSLATAEKGIRNPKGLNILFFTSPQHYMSYTNAEVDENVISDWRLRQEYRIKQNESKK
jgi:hypothetical protein